MVSRPLVTCNIPFSYTHSTLRNFNSISLLRQRHLPTHLPAATMGNCFSGGGHGQFAVGGTSSATDNHGSNDAMFSADHLSSLANCLKESTFCQPRVHGVWPVLVNILLPEIVSQQADSSTGLNSAKKHKKNRKSSSLDEDIQKNLQSFWDIIIEGSLLLSSHDRKHLVFDIILLVLPRLPVSCIPIVFSYKIVHCLVDILSTKDSWLYQAAEAFLKKLVEWVSFDDL